MSERQRPRNKTEHYKLRVWPGLMVLVLLGALVLTACDNTITPLTTPAPASATTNTITTSSATTAAINTSLTTEATTAITTVATSATSNTTTAATGLDFSQVDSYMQQMMQLYDVPGVGLGIVQNGQIVYTKGYGVRDTQTNAPVTPNTLFALGSDTKSFTALDVMQLVAAGKLALDTPIIKYLPDFKLSDPTATQKLTLRQLLSHTSGLPRADIDWYTGVEHNLQQTIADMQKIKLTAQPGQVWQYNNQNFALAGYIVAQISGQSWEDYTRQHIFDVLGMANANFDVKQSQQSSDFAAPHALDVLKGMQPIPFFTNLAAVGPAGEINANASDMARYIQFQLGDGTFGGKQLVPANLLNLMHTQQIAIPAQLGPPDANVTSGPAQTTTAPAISQTSGPTQPTAAIPSAATATTTATTTAAPQASSPLLSNTGYGLAWFTEDYRGHKLVEHGGNIDGFSASLTLIPDAKSGIVLLTNANGANLFIEAVRLRLVEMLDGLNSRQDIVTLLNKSTGFDPAALKAKLEAARIYKADPSTYQPLLGDYPSPAGKITLSLSNKQLRMTVDNQIKQAYQLIQYQPDAFLTNGMLGSGITISYKIDAHGTVTLYQEGTQLAQKLGKGVQAVEYKDPQNRFSFTVPNGLTAQPKGDLVVMHSTSPTGTLIVTTSPLVSDDNLPTSVKKMVIAKFDPSFDVKPFNTRAVAIPQGLTWTQFLYQLPNDQILAVLATSQKNTNYFVVIQAKTADIQALANNTSNLILSFKVLT